MKRLAVLKRAAACTLVAALLLAAACTSDQPPKPVRMATTTSTANTGLLDYLTKAFQAETGIELQFVAVGTGKALKHGENGDVDVLLVHAPKDEEKFVANGFGLARVPVMWNDFVIAGPAEDPAGVRGAPTAAEAFTRIRARQAPFISRADDSGTHKKEKEIWTAAQVLPEGAWYVEAGQGMEECLVMAREKRAYVLTDRGTYMARKDLELAILLEGDPLLINPYSLIAVNPARYPDLNTKGAQRLIDWMTSTHGQQLIADFKVDGQSLFNPGVPGAR